MSRSTVERATGVALTVELTPNLLGAVDARERLILDALDLVAEHIVSLGAVGAQLGIATASATHGVPRRGDRQHRADRLDPELAAMVFDEVHHHFCRWSNSAGSKYADAYETCTGRPRRIVCDNGSEFTSLWFMQWAARHGIEIQFIQPGKPTQNAFAESFNGLFRDECLNTNWF